MTTPILSFEIPESYDEEDEITSLRSDCIFSKRSDGSLCISIINGIHDDDWNPKEQECWFDLDAEQVATLREFLKRHYGE
jgi:hypothetical protein